MKWILMVAVLVLAACVPVTGPGGQASIDLAGTTWQLETIDGSAVVPGSTVTLQFDAEGLAGGNAGCNSYGGNFTLDGSSIEIGEIASTLMACVDEAMMDQEAAYLQALSSAQSVSVDGNRLTITYNGGTLEFVRAEG